MTARDLDGPVIDRALETLAAYPPQPEPRPQNPECEHGGKYDYQKGDCSTWYWQRVACPSCRDFYHLPEAP